MLQPTCMLHAQVLDSLSARSFHQQHKQNLHVPGIPALRSVWLLNERFLHTWSGAGSRSHVVGHLLMKLDMAVLHYRR